MNCAKTEIIDFGIKSTVRNGTYESLYLYTDLACEAIVQQQVITLHQDAFMLVSYNQKINAPNLDTIDRYEDLWTVVRTLARHVCNNWSRPDGGIWEIRSGRRHFVFSKVLCWVALDRTVQIAQLLCKPNDVRHWSLHRDRIKADVLKKGWNERLQSFTQAGCDNSPLRNNTTLINLRNHPLPRSQEPAHFLWNSGFFWAMTCIWPKKQ